MASLSKPADYFSYHINLIEHGRKTCSARNPKCSACILSDVCVWPEKVKYGWSSMRKSR